MYICSGSIPFNGGLGDLAMAKQKSQVEKFREAAKEAGTDESEQRFNERLKELARQKPEPEPKPKD
jgi:hypothetical protein